MLLSEKDIECLERKGFKRDFFVHFDSEGYSFLRNYNGYCIFYNAEKRLCKIYGNRPLGCRIYPVIYDEDRGILVDALCPSCKLISEKQITKRGKKVINLLKNIDAEAKKRRDAFTNQNSD